MFYCCLYVVLFISYQWWYLTIVFIVLFVKQSMKWLKSTWMGELQLWLRSNSINHLLINSICCDLMTIAIVYFSIVKKAARCNRCTHLGFSPVICITMLRCVWVTWKLIHLTLIGESGSLGIDWKRSAMLREACAVQCQALIYFESVDDRRVPA